MKEALNHFAEMLSLDRILKFVTLQHAVRPSMTGFFRAERVDIPKSPVQLTGCFIVFVIIVLLCAFTSDKDLMTRSQTTNSAQQTTEIIRAI